MPPKAVKGLQAASAPVESVPVLLERLASGYQPASRTGSSRADAAVKLWTHVVQSTDSKRSELIKQGAVPLLVVLAERGDHEEAYAAMGCLQALVQSGSCRQEVCTLSRDCNRAIAIAGAMLSGAHDRSRQPAAQFLQAISCQPERVAQLEPLMPALLQLLRPRASFGWAGMRRTQHAAALVLKALLGPSEYEAGEVKQARRQVAIQQGAVGSLVALLADCKHNDAGAAAAACLRFLALSPDFVPALCDSDSTQQLVELLMPSQPLLCAYVGGIMWELTADPDTAQLLLAAGIVPVLLAVVRAVSSAGLSKLKKKKASAKDVAAKGSKSSTSKGSKGSAPASAAAAPYAAVEDPPLTALCNTTGALHHLSFLDDAKRDIAVAGGAETLVKLLKCSHAQTYDNVVGALWNLALLPDNQPLLKEAKAPAFLTRPVPARWQAVDDPAAVVSTPHRDSGMAGQNVQRLTLTSTVIYE